MDVILKHWPIIIVVVGGITAFVSLQNKVDTMALAQADLKQSQKEMRDTMTKIGDTLASLDKTLAVLNQRVLMIEQPRK